MDEDQPDERWLADLQKKGPQDSEASRIGQAFRTRHARHQQESTGSKSEFQRLERRLENESLFGPSARLPKRRNYSLFNRQFPQTWQWTIPSLITILAGLLIWQPFHQDRDPARVSLDEAGTYRGQELDHITRRFEDLNLAGHQFQIVNDLQDAESRWKAALIEAGMSFVTNRSTTIPDAIEIHVRLSSAITQLDPGYRLKSAPEKGEWVLFLILEKTR
jgi:hypothetical protein